MCRRDLWNCVDRALTHCLQGQAHRGDLALAVKFETGRKAMLSLVDGCGVREAAIVQLENGTSELDGPPDTDGEVDKDMKSPND